MDWLRPARSADGWFSPELGQRFYRRWEDLAREEKAKSKIKNPEEKDYEFDKSKLSAVAMDLRRYAAGDIKAKNLYSYSLVDMNEKFNAPNELKSCRQIRPKSKSFSLKFHSAPLDGIERAFF